MLRVASFKISDADGINTLLSEYKIAAGAHILISDGHVCIPYEDGKPKDAVHQILDIKEEMNKMIDQIAIIEQSNSVLDMLMDDADDRLQSAEADMKEAESRPGSKEKAATIANIKERIGALKQGKAQLESQKRQNEHEILRLSINLQKFEERIQKIQLTA